MRTPSLLLASAFLCISLVIALPVGKIESPRRELQGGQAEWWLGLVNGGTAPTPDSPLTGPTNPDHPRSGAKQSSNSGSGGAVGNTEPTNPERPRSGATQMSGSGSTGPTRPERPRTGIEARGFGRSSSSDTSVGSTGLRRRLAGYFSSWMKAFSTRSYTNAYFVVSPSTLIAVDPSMQKAIKEFVVTAEAENNLPTLAIEGWTDVLSNAATTPTRTAFAKFIADFYHAYGFKAVKIEWERSVDVPDKTENLAACLQELRSLLPDTVFTGSFSDAGIHKGLSVEKAVLSDALGSAA